MSQHQINFVANASEEHFINKIGARASALHNDGTMRDYAARRVSSFVRLCHLNGSPLRLKDLAESSDQDFLHDVLGIQKHLSRETGKLEGNFIPRFLAKE